MEDKYKQWIDANYPTMRSAFGMCGVAAKNMGEAFPELRVTNGTIMVLGDNTERLHWWCVAPDGTIVDPTRIQYTAILDYEEIDDSHPARNYPRVKCRECGEYYYVTPELTGTMHTTQCETAYIDYLSKEIDK